MIEVRDASPGFWSASGFATSWGRGSKSYLVVEPDGTTFRERIARNAFADATAGVDHVELRLEHRPSGPTFASTRTGTLAFEDASSGLLLGAALNKSDSATRAGR